MWSHIIFEGCINNASKMLYLHFYHLPVHIGVANAIEIRIVAQAWSNQAVWSTRPVGHRTLVFLATD